MAAAFHRFAENFLGKAAGVNVSGIKKIDSSVEANGNQTAGLSHVARSPGAKEFASPAKRGGAKAECRNF